MAASLFNCSITSYFILRAGRGSHAGKDYSQCYNQKDQRQWKNIYKLLNNRTLLGVLRHKERWYQAEHPPIIDRDLWAKVHFIFATNERVRGNIIQSKVPNLLKDIVFGYDDRALSP